MATKKKLLQAAAGSAGGGAGALNVEDVFSTYLYEGNGDTQVIENGINLGQSNSGASIYFPDGDGDYLATASLPQFTGAFTFEFWFYSYDSARAVYLIDKDVRDTNLSIQTNYLTDDQLFVKVAGTSFSYTTAGLDADGWNHIAVVRDSSDNVATFVNGTRRGSPTTASGSVTGGVYYIGSSSAGISASGYELMYGHMSSVRISDTARYSTGSTSITVPTSEYTSDSNTVLLLGQGDTPLADASSNSYSVTVNGNPRASEVGPFDAADAGEGGLVWVKNRTSSNDNLLYDTERGANNYLSSNTTSAEGTITSLSSFNANGFTVSGSGTYINGTATDYASWTFRKAPKFFDVVTYTGTGSPRTISHNLGTTVGCMLVKRTSGTTNWRVYHRSNTSQPETDYLMLDSTFSTQDSNTVWNDTAPTDTEFTVGTSSTTNGNGETYVAYLFAHNDGDGDFGDGTQDIIKCGSCAGANVTVDLGFEPQLLITKAYDTSSNWHIQDNMRTFDRFLKPQASDAEVTDTTNLPKITSTGFEVPSTFLSGSNMIYIAIRRGPMAVPTAATDVFGIQAYNGNGTNQLSLENGPLTDFGFFHHRSSASGPYSFTRLTGSERYLRTSTTGVEAGGFGWFFDTMSGMYLDGTASYINGPVDSNVLWQWKRAPSFFDVVAYTGNGTAGRTVSHNLGVAPEMMWVKRRDGSGGGWMVYHKDLGNTKYLQLEDTYAAGTLSSAWNNTSPTDTDFTLGTFLWVNYSSYTYIAYLFASLDGVSKVGSYTGNGTSQNIDCGFSSGARFILIKRTDSADGWFVHDTERGIVTGNDPYLQLNTTDAEAGGNDIVDPYSAGFTVNNFSGWNASGGSYIFYAIA